MEASENLYMYMNAAAESELLLNVCINADGLYRDNSLGPGEQEYREVRHTY